MQLYFFPIAPNPTKVRLYLAEKAEGGCAILLEEVVVNLIAGEQKSDAHFARNPFGKLPVLELEDGSFIRESLSIIQYLEDLYPEPPLIGADPRERARVRDLERVAEQGVLASVARIVHATDSPLGLASNPAVADFFRELLPPNLAFLEAALVEGGPFIAGERPTIADCTLAAALQFGRFRKLEFLDDYEHLGRWDAFYRERPAAKSVLVM
jgi:glutathione S-transferase